jgi:hypothetical protein
MAAVAANAASVAEATTRLASIEDELARLHREVVALASRGWE